MMKASIQIGWPPGMRPHYRPSIKIGIPSTKTFRLDDSAFNLEYTSLTGYVDGREGLMPKIPQDVLKSSFFVYEKLADAEKAINPIGTGFLIGVASKKQTIGSRFFASIFATTNQHVVRDRCAVRIEDVCAETKEDDWIFNSTGDDFAITPIRLDHCYDTRFIPTTSFATEEFITENEIGVGDDVFMFGLYVDNQNYATGIPSARFGHISMMPHEQATAIVQNATGPTAPSIILDMHSRSGFSGSPVFVYRTPGSNLDHANSGNLMLNEGALFKFLGIHWGQFPEFWRRDSEDGSRDLIEGVSGMTVAIPAWRVLKFIETNPRLQDIIISNERAIGMLE